MITLANIKQARRLRQVALFEGCPTRELVAADRLVTQIRLPAGSELISEGSTGREFFVIAEGEVSVHHGGAEVARIGPGGFVGELALLEHQPRNASVHAIGDVSLLVQSRREFSTLLKVAPTVAARVRAAAEERRAA